MTPSTHLPTRQTPPPARLSDETRRWLVATLDGLERIEHYAGCLLCGVTLASRWTEAVLDGLYHLHGAQYVAGFVCPSCVPEAEARAEQSRPKRRAPRSIER